MTRIGTGTLPPSDIDSDASFIARQNELRSLYRDFRSTIEVFRQLSPSRMSQGETPVGDGEDEFSQSSELNSQIEFLMGEIEILQTDTDDIVALITQPKFAKYPRVREIKKKLHRLQASNAAMRSRAELLLDS
jgi:hypothetical protein